MARRKIGRITEVKTNFTDYNYLLNGVGGIGKTTMLAEIGMKLCGTDGLLLLSIGREPLPDHLGGVWNERAKDWDDLEEIIDTVVEYKNEDYPNLKMVGIDSVDELFRLAEKKVVEMHNESVDKPDKMVKVVGAAFGGFQKGENKVIDIVSDLLFRLNDVGVKIFYIGHTKKKNAKDLKTEIEYELLTSNLDAKYYNCIKDKVNLVGCAYIEREMTDTQTVRDAFTKGNKKIGRIQSEQRVVSFRDEEHAIDNKSHFKFIKDKCGFETDVFLDTVIDAIKKQSEAYGKNNFQKSALAPSEKDEEKETLANEDIAMPGTIIEEVAEKDEKIVDQDKNKQLKKEFVPKYKEATSEQKVKVSEILAKYNTKKLDDKKPTKMFEELLEIFE